MNMSYRRQVLALTDTELESFVRAWTSQKVQDSQYESCQNFAGPGDMGRDVVGFLSQHKHEGDWHNYQCKQYGSNLPTDKAILDIGKIIYYASQGFFTLPTQTNFVAPKGINRNLSTLIFNPSKMKDFIKKNWDKYCKGNISQSFDIPLTQELIDKIEEFDFSSINHVGIETILSDDAAKKVLYDYFGADPGPAPIGKAPQQIQANEMNYIQHLIDAYNDEDSATYQTVHDISRHKEHLAVQRERFFDAESFKRFYRDNLDASVLNILEYEIFHGIIDVCLCGGYSSKLKCVDAVMKHASTVSPSGVLAKHTRITVKQGICHHFANEDKLKWNR